MDVEEQIRSEESPLGEKKNGWKIGIAENYFKRILYLLFLKHFKSWFLLIKKINFSRKNGGLILPCWGENLFS